MCFIFPVGLKGNLLILSGVFVSWELKQMEASGFPAHKKGYPNSHVSMTPDRDPVPTRGA